MSLTCIVKRFAVCFYFPLNSSLPLSEFFRGFLILNFAQIHNYKITNFVCDILNYNNTHKYCIYTSLEIELTLPFSIQSPKIRVTNLDGKLCIEHIIAITDVDSFTVGRKV
jgi:hypothetical protein